MKKIDLNLNLFHLEYLSGFPKQFEGEGDKMHPFFLTQFLSAAIRTSPPPRINGIASDWTSVGRLKENEKKKENGVININK
jgi:hypothetical protein